MNDFKTDKEAMKTAIEEAFPGALVKWQIFDFGTCLSFGVSLGEFRHAVSVESTMEIREPWGNRDLYCHPAWRVIDAFREALDKYNAFKQQ